MKPFRESNQSKIDSDYMEFMRRMYAEEHQSNQTGIAGIVLLSIGIAACIAIIICQLS